MIIYIQKENNKLYICDREMFKNEKQTIGSPEYMICAEDFLPESIKKTCGKLEEGKSYKMVIKFWPIE